MNERPKLPLPTGLIGQAESVRFDPAGAKPFFPFLSLQQLFLLIAIYLVVTGILALAVAVWLGAPREIWVFMMAGSAMGMLPSIIEAAPARVTVRTPRPGPWADFTRQWAIASRYLPSESDNDIWLPNMPFWIKWPGDSIRLRVTENELHVRGRRLLMRQLKRNFDRITERGYSWPDGAISS